jgi:mRNA interferase MazF
LRSRYPEASRRMRGGEVWWVALDPTIGGEIGKTRPAVIVSNDRSNRETNRVQIVPVTSSKRRIYPSEALVSLEGSLSKTVADQIRTVDKRRLLAFMDRISDAEMRAVEDAVRLQLGLG